MKDLLIKYSKILTLKLFTIIKNGIEQTYASTIGSARFVRTHVVDGFYE